MAKKTSESKPNKLVMRQSVLIKYIVLLAVVILAASLWGWWHEIRSDPERTFYAAIDNSLRTNSASKFVSQEGLGQQLEQTVDFELSPEHVARGRTTLSQTGEQSTTIKTETISTPSQQYVRYTEIDAPQAGNDDGQSGFEDLVNKWGSVPSSSPGALGELYGETVLGVVPFADFTASERSEVMSVVKENNVYAFNSEKVKQRIENGRPVYVYEVEVDPQGYIKMLKEFGAQAGVNQFRELQPESYKGAEAISLTIKVDVWSRNVTEVVYEAGRSEQYFGYGIVHTFDLPEETIPLDELHQQLQQVQQPQQPQG